MRHVRPLARNGSRALVACSLVLGLTILAGATSAAAAPPPNDDFANAVDLGSATSGGPVAGTNTEASLESGEPLHGGVVGGHSLWYVWHAPGTASFQFSASGLGAGTVLAVYTGSSVGSLTPVVANEHGTPSSVCFTPSAAGDTYYIAIDGEAGTTGTTSLSWHVFTGGAPCPTSQPQISSPSAPHVGDQLSGTGASWLPAGPAETYEWWRCVRASCVRISGASSLTYTLGEADVGRRLRLVVRASDAGGTFDAASAPSPLVASATQNANGAEIAFASDRAGTFDIYRSPAAGGVATALTTATTGDELQPNWSTHGNASAPDQIAFQTGGQLEKVNTVTGTVASIGVSGTWPAFRRTGVRIAYAASGGIALVNDDGSSGGTVTSNAGDTHPSYSSVGTAIVFERGGDIWVASSVSGDVPCQPGSSGACRLTETGTDSEPAWSPDGLRVAFVRAGALWTMDSDGGNPTEVATPGLSVADPAWSPDGTRLLFSGSSGGTADIYSVGTDGSDLTDLTPGTSSSSEIQPTWQPQAIAPEATFPPTISGTAAVGSVLTGSDGVYFNSTIPYTITGRSWLRCDSTGAACADTGSTGTTYTVAESDAGSTLRFRVQVENSAGSSTFQSTQTGVVPPSGSGGGGGGSTGGGGDTGSGSTGGGSGGGGRADLSVAVVPDKPTVRIAEMVVFRISVQDETRALVQGVHVRVVLPAGATVVWTYSDRGPGCTPDGAGALDCNVDFLSGNAPVGHLIVTVKASAAGPLTLAAAVRSTQPDIDPADNAASANVQVAGSPPPPQAKPSPTPTCRVPRLNHLSLAKARAIAGRSGCRVVVVGRRHSLLRRGVVRTQAPRPGRLLASRIPLRVVVSLGPNRAKQKRGATG